MTETYRSRSITIGHLPLGGDAPVRIQSMTNTPTSDISASVAQCLRMIDAGAEMVRLTTQGKREITALGKIRQELRNRGYTTPVIADIHFNPGLALEAAGMADKIRINPGNYLKGDSPEHLLPPLLDRCREQGTAIRIGVNHGSLERTIVEEFGDTPQGIVESAMRFLRVCSDQDFQRVVVSMKSSNPRVMVQSVRLLVKQMALEKMNYPLHLGVTEAGDGTEGRIKSVVGMAPLLLEGMGDTVRVSLTEPPEEEIPVARELIRLFPKPGRLPYDPGKVLAWDPYSFNRRIAREVRGIGSGSKVKIIGNHPPEPGSDLTVREIMDHCVTYSEWLDQPALLEHGGKILLLEQGSLSIHEVKSRLNHFCLRNRRAPVLYKTALSDRNPESFRIRLAGEMGFLLMDGAVDAVWVDHPHLAQDMINETLLCILQASGSRISRAEYIACPSCGRTHFDILTRLREIRRATSHLTGIKIAVMGCIVNGPGEMADAHYGYVGAGIGRVTLYKGKSAIQKNIPEAEAVEALITLIRKEGDWKDPDETASDPRGQ
jgi:(E)-4-hydroxy-3-methylbut-2-enyl-diphosphate synthase